MHHPETRNKTKQSLVIIDTKSRLTHSAEIKSASTEEVIKVLLAFMIHVQVKPKEIVSDRESCFTSTLFGNWLIEKGIKITYCSPNKHEGNAYAERVIGTLRRKAISLLNHSRLSKTFYSDALDQATTLYNRAYHKGIEATPFEVAFDAKLTTKDLERFITFGSTIFFENNQCGVYLANLFKPNLT